MKKKHRYLLQNIDRAAKVTEQHSAAWVSALYLRSQRI
jgi:hypothetical protein